MTTLRKIVKRIRNEKGQTLIFAVLAMIIILLAVIFLFDMQSVIRTKIKSQTAVDAAALTGANWQRHSLNLIGELNIIKACTVLISEIPPVGEDSLENITGSSDLLTEMQARVSFVGPLIGFGAAQQAAKNNGLNYNEDYGLVVESHIGRLESDEFYGEEFVSQVIENYAWRVPYIDMVRMVYNNGKGIAVGVNSQYQGMPALTSDPPDFIAYLQQRWLYTAIHANYWCALRNILRMDFSDQKWWGDIELLQDTTSFPREAEYLPIHIDFTSGAGPYDEAYDATTNTGPLATLAFERGLTLLREEYDEYDEDDPADTDGRPNPLPQLRWGVYDTAHWSLYSEAFMDQWDVYLRTYIQRKFAYFGAVTKTRIEFQPQTLTGDWGKSGGGDDKYLGDEDALGFYDDYDRSTGNRLKQAERRMKNSLDMIDATALAKPLGSLPDIDMPPNYLSMVLPVFDKTVIIPVSLENPGGADPFDYRWYAFLTEYLPLLGTVDNIEEMPDVIQNSEYADHWGWFQYYHYALLKLDDPEWRQMGIDWLDTPLLDENGDPMLDDDGNPLTNEDNCDYWPSGSGGGSRDGPTFLH